MIHLSPERPGDFGVLDEGHRGADSRCQMVKVKIITFVFLSGDFKGCKDVSAGAESNQIPFKIQ